MRNKVLWGLVVATLLFTEVTAEEVASPENSDVQITIESSEKSFPVTLDISGGARFMCGVPLLGASGRLWLNRFALEIGFHSIIFINEYSVRILYKPIQGKDIFVGVGAYVTAFFPLGGGWTGLNTCCGIRKILWQNSYCQLAGLTELTLYPLSYSSNQEWFIGPWVPTMGINLCFGIINENYSFP